MYTWFNYIIYIVAVGLFYIRLGLSYSCFILSLKEYFQLLNGFLQIYFIYVTSMYGKISVMIEKYVDFNQRAKLHSDLSLFDLFFDSLSEVSCFLNVCYIIV